MDKEQAQAPLEQWHGEVEARLPLTTADAAWPHVASFSAADRYMLGIDVCELVAGKDGHPGCVRHVAARESATWAREELLELDAAARRLRYAVVDSNMGFGRYVATVRVADADAGEAGCKLVWSFECEPVHGWSEDGLVAYLDMAVKAMAKKVEEKEEEAEAAAALDKA